MHTKSHVPDETLLEILSIIYIYNTLLYVCITNTVIATRTLCPLIMPTPRVFTLDFGRQKAFSEVLNSYKIYQVQLRTEMSQL